MATPEAAGATRLGQGRSSTPTQRGDWPSNGRSLHRTNGRPTAASDSDSWAWGSYATPTLPACYMSHGHRAQTRNSERGSLKFSRCLTALTSDLNSVSCVRCVRSSTVEWRRGILLLENLCVSFGELPEGWTQLSTGGRLPPVILSTLSSSHL